MHVHFRRKFKSKRALTGFTHEFRDYIHAEARRIPKSKLLDQETMLALTSKRNNILFGLKEDYMDLMVMGSDRSEDLRRLDDFLNRIIAFLDLSTPAIGVLGVAYSKAFPLVKGPSGSPISKYVDKGALAEFSSRSGLFLNPAGLVLSKKTKDKGLLVILEYDEDEDTTEVDITEVCKDLRLEQSDILTKRDNSLESQKDHIFAGLGVKAK